jgi:hypothetical protein
MLRIWLIPVVALISVVIPSVVQAQTYAVPLCNGVNDRNSYGAPLPCIPTDVPAWLRPAPPVPPPAPMRPAVPAYRAPAPAGRGLDPWIPLAVAPTPAPRPLDLTQLILLQQLAAERRQHQAAPTPAVRTPAPPPAASGENWMSGFIKGVKK